jgi:hypothetical protein
MQHTKKSEYRMKCEYFERVLNICSKYDTTLSWNGETWIVELYDYNILISIDEIREAGISIVSIYKKRYNNTPLCLYTIGQDISAEEYIINYNSIPIIFGADPLSEKDCQIIRKCNRSEISL